MLRNSKGKKDGMWTLSVGAFLVVVLRVLLGMFKGVTIGTFALTFREIDPLVIGALLTPTFFAYVGRRNNILTPKPGPQE